MEYQFKLITQEQAEEVAYNWHYHGEFAFYDMEADEEDLAEFIDPKARGESTYAVMENNELIGFCNFAQNNNTVEVGLGLRPDLTGKGKGLNFVANVINFTKALFSPNQIILSVATFNQRAIKVYEKSGFKAENTYMQDTNGSSYEFLRMVYHC